MIMLHTVVVGSHIMGQTSVVISSESANDILYKLQELFICVATSAVAS